MSTLLYRGGKLGDSLCDALGVLVDEGKIGGDLATEVLSKVISLPLSSATDHEPCRLQTTILTSLESHFFK